MKTQIEKQSFTDYLGNTWFVDIDVVTRRKLKRECGVELMELTVFPPENWGDMSKEERASHVESNGGNMMTCSATVDTDVIDQGLWICCKEQAAHLNYNEVQFWKILNGSDPTPDYKKSLKKGEQCYAQAVQAWTHAVINFTRMVGAEVVANLLEKNLNSVMSVRKKMSEAFGTITQEAVDELTKANFRLKNLTGTESSNSSVSSVESDIRTKISEALHSEPYSGDTEPKSENT